MGYGMGGQECRCQVIRIPSFATMRTENERVCDCYTSEYAKIDCRDLLKPLTRRQLLRLAMFANI